MLNTSLKVLVVQMGARRGYELARMLESRGTLAALHTSLAWHSDRVACSPFERLVPAGPLARRTVREVPIDKLRTTPLPEVFGGLLSRLGILTERRYRIEDWLLGLDVRRCGLAGANVVLNTAGNGGDEFLHWAKRAGAKIASDIVVTPRAHEIVAEERRRWPGWEPGSDDSRTIELSRRHFERVVAVSDLVLCPSETVQDGLATIQGYDPGRVARVPYALGAINIIHRRPTPRRILFAGAAGLRKGLPYLAEAARLLKPRGYEVRVAGGTQEVVRSRPECRDLIFLGHLGPDRMEEEFRNADIFCLPSLAEGMACVTLEALAHGVPCVVTRSAGSPVRHGKEGLIVPERDGAAIAEALTSIGEDRGLRQQMSTASLVRAEAHRLPVVAEILLESLEALVRSPKQ